MTTERNDQTRLFTFEKKTCPGCGQAIGWRQFSWWNLIQTRWTRLHCPSCHARVQLHSPFMLHAVVIVAFIVGLDFATDFHMSKHPVTVAIAFLILIFVVCPLFTLWFVSVRLKDEKA